MSQKLTAIQKIKNALHSDAVQEGLAAQLPSDVPVDKFTAVVIRAIQEDPDLLQADKRSLLLACQRAAQDGLIPDKREGALVVYSTKQGDQWIKKVQWQAMIGGLRKRLAKNGFDIRAEVVHEGDFFDQDLGDNPTITHKPPPLDSKRGNIIGAYAIATHAETGTRYREVMSIDQINEIRAVARSDKIWSKWFAEMARKTAARRLIKMLPITDEDARLAGMIERDNESYDLTKHSGLSETAKAVQEAAREPAQAIEHKEQDLPPVQTQEQPPEAVQVESENPGPAEEANVPVSEGGMEPGF